MSLSGSTLNKLSSLIEPAGAVLDLGCNDGGLLEELARARSDVHLSGLDLDAEAVSRARAKLPAAAIHVGSVDALPFPDGAFDLVTCMDVLEHLPEAVRPGALAEAWRVLRPAGHLVIETPHRGMFQVLDAQNLRHRFPQLYRRLPGRGVRDRAYAGRQEVVWHQHFSRDELLALAGRGWRLADESYPGLLVFPLMDLLSWPFNRTRRRDHPVARALQRAGEWDVARDYGPRRGYEIVLTLQRAG
jgi:SAM-dependent methyltransferase